MNIRNLPVRLCAVLIASLVTISAQAEGDPGAGKALFPVCTACHGPQGQGNQAMNAPKLAGQESWYIIKQMQLFQNDARSMHITCTIQTARPHIARHIKITIIKTYFEI